CRPSSCATDGSRSIRWAPPHRKPRFRARSADNGGCERRLIALRSAHPAQGADASCVRREGGRMTGAAPIAQHSATGDVYALIISALEASSKSLDSLGVEDLAPIDHFHARGFPATVELGDRLPVEPGDDILDIGCGL